MEEKATTDFKMVERNDFLLQLCAGQSVLHLGCTDYPYTLPSIQNGMLLHFELSGIARELYGIDADPAGIDILRSHGATNILRGDLEHLAELDLNRTFDVVIAGEMIEHLSNPGLFLTGIRRFMRPGSKLVITTINAYCGMRFLYYGLRGRKGAVEPVHPDHVAYYSYSTLKLLAERHGMQVDRFLFYDIGRRHRPHNRWFLNLANDIAIRIARQWSDGIIAVCVIDEDRENR
jgi:SAM-dependent methyltransferase